MAKGFSTGALFVRIGVGVYNTILIIRSPQTPCSGLGFKGSSKGIYTPHRDVTTILSGLGLGFRV